MVSPGARGSARLYGRSWGCCSVSVPRMRAPSSVWQTVGEICPAWPDRQSLWCSVRPGEGAYRIPSGIFIWG
ncbi:hypothetical protein XELAEV_18032950mg [Xenopus laevis]|uniref:Uncharacterized protein n=1 Tax=Xenopus laevis TaxID=8355 RepID=A0A974CII6_XENLA|nr:hypothetical protein XELAEV_18032950mg [Xenopus laevis]